jgi:hypothetical protein
MKLFGKKKKSTPVKEKSKSDIQDQDSLATTTSKSITTTKEDNIDEEHVQSYFSKEKSMDDQKSKANAKKQVDVEDLLKLDPSTLNSKQKRIIRRHHERMNDDDKKEKQTNDDCDKDSQSKSAETKATGVNFEESGDDCKEEVKNTSGYSLEKNHDNEKDKKDDDSDDGSSSDSSNDSESENIEHSSDKEIGSNKMDVDKNTNEEDPKVTQAIHSSADTVDVDNSNEVNQAMNIQEDQKDDQGGASIEMVSQIVEKLKTLNSKERRKLLRQLETENKLELVEKVKEESKKIASQNEQLEKEKHELAMKEQERKKDEKISMKRKLEEQKATSNTSSKETDEQKSKDTDTNTQSQDTNQPGKKKRKLKDLSHLLPAERERREQQRLMQIEAAKRRANGEVDKTRHPLNSERRRANRRKPGRIGKIVLLKKEAKEKQENLKMFNASGFHMRRAKKEENGM